MIRPEWPVYMAGPSWPGEARFYMRIASFSIVACLLSAQASVRADVFQLKDGGEVAGTVVEKNEAGDVVVRTAAGAVVSLKRDMLQRIIEENAALAEYHERSRKTPDTAEAQRQLAEWCRQHKLADEADLHLMRVAELDPNDEEARRTLGFQKIGDRWLNADELMAVRGMQFFDGKYRTAQDIAIRQRNKQEDTVSIDWFKKIRLWRDWLDRGRPERAAEAHAQIAAINNPSAAPALVRLLDEEKNHDIFELMLATLAQLDHPQAVQTLVSYSLDPDIGRETRAQCLDYLTSGRYSVSIVPYVEALKSKNNKVVNLAGQALDRIGDPAAISPLIDALVTTHKYLVQPEPSGGGSPIGAAFGSGGGASSGGLSMGGNGPKQISRDEQNESVRQALIKLSGKQNFEFDKQAWRAWFVDLQMRQRVNTRRDE
jgi:hypothetical protein